LTRRPPERRTEPFYWRDPERAAPFCPVVGVSWFEAETYCNWLTKELRKSGALGRDEVARLPTELEWERTARGTDGREYPWEGGFQAAFTNTPASELDATTAVCTYPQGASPPGAWDMTGNVWEWTGSLSSRDEIERRIVRGGSWYDDLRFARCAFRSGVIPGRFLDTLGFRVVLSLANSES
jgi:formylglycine-generating enzyme required for sulfatase activity